MNNLQARTGWLFDLYPSAQSGATLWLLGDDGIRYRLQHRAPVIFYACGPTARLRAAWQFLNSQPIEILLSRAERRELFTSTPLSVLAIQVIQAVQQPALFQRLLKAFPELDYYDADVSLPLRFAAAYGIFPLARCRILADEQANIHSLEALDTPWELDPQPPPLRTLSLEPDCDPNHAEPLAVLAQFERFHYRFPLNPPRPLLINLQALLKRHDPDLLLTSWGDTWLLPKLLELVEKCEMPLAFNRDASLPVAARPEHTYFSYGQIVYRGQQTLLFGRWHIDRHNATLFHDYGMEGIYEFARVTRLPVQDSARLSPGTGISAMQIVTALQDGILVPWHKQKGERLKTALELMQRDQGGLIYQPLIGVHSNVAEIDFVSMYPSLMVRFNISPETAGDHPGNPLALERFPDNGSDGLVPKTLAPLLEKRIALKTRLAQTPAWHPRRKADQARSSSHKWLLVTCFGYLGYKNARFGRIEAHEAVTAYGREALLRAKEAAEDLNCTVLHLYVDGLWIKHPDWQTTVDWQPLLEEIAQRTGLSIGLDGIFRWIVFLSSRMDQRVPVANRYFGVFEDGSIKVRGIEARRRDTAAWISDVQMQMLEHLAQAPTSRELPQYLPETVNILRRAVSDLNAGRIPLEELLVSQKMSRDLEAYRTPSPAARAALQLQQAGKTVRPGQRVRFLYTLGRPGVWAWNIPDPPNPAAIDKARYRTLLLRAGSAILQPFGIQENALQLWVLDRVHPLKLALVDPPHRAIVGAGLRPTPTLISSSCNTINV